MNPVLIGMNIKTEYCFQGSLSDLKGRRNILIVTLLLCSVSYLSLGFTESVITILCVRAILGK